MWQHSFVPKVAPFFHKCLCKILKVNKSWWEVATWFLFPQLHLLRQRPSFLRPRFLSFCALVKNIFPCGEFTKKNAEKGSRRNMKGKCRKISERKWNGCKEFDLLYYTELNNKGCLKIRLKLEHKENNWDAAFVWSWPQHHSYLMMRQLSLNPCSNLKRRLLGVPKKVSFRTFWNRVLIDHPIWIAFVIAPLL